jgi:outer membrane protein OmpA-like peptidoglycan-associated protein
MEGGKTMAKLHHLSQVGFKIRLLEGVTILTLTMVGFLAFAEENEPGVTDLSGADPSAITVSDIVEALAVPRGTRIRPTEPPTVRLPIYFEFNSTELQPEARSTLDDVSDALKTQGLQTFRFRIEGHTDDRGAIDYNEVLSGHRALKVRSYLVESGVPEEKLEAEGFGEANPVADNGTDQGRNRNRRVEIVNLGSPQ